MDISETTSPNRHITEYLTYYLSLTEPHYAVLLDGPWGIGKTFLVDRFLQSHFSNPYDYLYVSLYGVKNAEEIDMALLQSMHPWTNTKTTKIVGRIASAACQFFNIEPDLKATDIFARPAAQIYVFDDLERCEMPLNSSLGYLNDLVEHDGCRVAIIANTKELHQETFQKRKEKLVGKTLEVKSSYGEAFTHFLAQIDGKTRPLLAKHSEAIAAVYQQSDLNNLRILQQTMWDFERVLHCWSDLHLKNDEALLSAVRLFFSVSFEIRSGRMTSADIARKNSWSRYLDKEAEPTPLESARKRYVGTDLYDSVLSDQMLLDIIVRGLVDEDSIRACLDHSKYFVATTEEPAWRTAWHFFERADDAVLPAYSVMEQSFLNREYEIIGEILHVMGLRLQMSDIGVLEKGRAEVVAEAKAYIDDLYSQKRLTPLPNNRSDEDFRFGGYGGLGIHQADTPDYQMIFDYLRSKRQKATEDTYPTIARQLLNEMIGDPDLFFRRICITNTADSLYADLPILPWIDPHEFVKHLVKLHPANQRTIFVALKSRYEHGNRRGILTNEKTWLEAVSEKLLATMESVSALDRFRLQHFIQSSIGPILKSESPDEV